MRNSMLVAGLTLFVTACGSAPSAPNMPAPIDPNAVIVMTQTGFPKMYEKLGPASFERANILSRKAASKAAADEGCDRVEYVGVSDVSSSVAIEIFVDCKNSKRLRYGEADLK